MLLTRKRVAWDAYLDTPVGLTLRQEPGTSTETIAQVVMAEQGQRAPGPGAAGTREGWLVILGITNPGLASVRSRDFSVPMTFTFPGREIHATQISPEPAVPASTARQLPAARVSTVSDLAGNHAARLQLSGDFLLRPGHSYSVIVILSGTPAQASPRIQQEGWLANGKIITTPGTEP